VSLDEASPPKRSRLTPTDRAILALLEEDSRRTTTEIAEKIGVSRTTVKNRISLLRQRGIIKRFTVEIENKQHANMNCIMSVYLIQLKRPVCRLVFQKIRGWPELIQAWSLTGDTDFLVLVKAQDSSGVERLREQLLRHPEVKNVTTAIVLHEWVKRIGLDELGKPLE
jgi:Lrp/AsnC family transcriptional regulator, leucine-responsive regulatory protein